MNLKKQHIDYFKIIQFLMSKIDNIYYFCKENNLKVITSHEELLKRYNENKLSFSFELLCEKNHTLMFVCSSFVNEKSRFKKRLLIKKNTTFCSKCNSLNDTFDRYNDKIKEIGHILLEVFPERKCRYQCGSCDEIHMTIISNLVKNKGSCPNCRNEKFKYTIERVREIANGMGMKLLSTKYESNSSKLLLICKCGKEYQSRLKELLRGKHCMNCKTEKYVETCIERYGVINTFQVEEFKEKSRQTNLERYGVEYPQQSKEINLKTQETCLERYGVNFAFNQTWVYKKIQSTHIKNWGYPFPLMSKEIQNKIKETWRKNYGVDYPLMSKDIQDLCRFAFFEKYGVDNPMHVPEFFHKSQTNSFIKKEFIFPSGRLEMIQGYEHYALSLLLDPEFKLFGNMKITEDIILLGKDIEVFHYNTDDGKNHNYYPDIQLTFTDENNNLKNIIIEVKSLYTFEKDIDVNFLKLLSVKEKGYNAYLWIFEEEGELIDSIEF